MRPRLLLTLVAALAGALTACGPTQISNPAPAAEGPFDRSHAGLDALLQRHVRDGLVDYGSLAADRPALDGYLASVAAVDPATFEGWSRADQLSFLINAYNAYTLQLIVEHWPVASIKDTHVANNPWDHFEFPLLGESVTLNQMEHTLIRPVYEEPRIHFALVCAARSCPPLLSRAYTGDALEATLAEVTRSFLEGPENDLSDPQRIMVSPLFDWYGEDFVAESGTLQAYVAEHSGQAVLPDAEVDFAPYNWAINAQ